MVGVRVEVPIADKVVVGVSIVGDGIIPTESTTASPTRDCDSTTEEGRHTGDASQWIEPDNDERRIKRESKKIGEERRGEGRIGSKQDEAVKPSWSGTRIFRKCRSAPLTSRSREPLCI